MHRVEQRLSMSSYRGLTSNNPKLWEFGSNLINFVQLFVVNSFLIAVVITPASWPDFANVLIASVQSSVVSLPMSSEVSTRISFLLLMATLLYGCS